jgi:hypothetical protein
MSITGSGLQVIQRCQDQHDKITHKIIQAGFIPRPRTIAFQKLNLQLHQLKAIKTNQVLYDNWKLFI